MTFTEYMKRFRQEHVDALENGDEHVMVAIPAIALNRLIRSYFMDYLLSNKLRAREDAFLRSLEVTANDNTPPRRVLVRRPLQMSLPADEGDKQ